MGADYRQDSLSPADVEATLRVARSSRLRVVWLAVAGVAWSAFMGASGWVSAKLDVKLEIETLSGKVNTLSGRVEVLTSQQQDLVKSIAKLSSDDEDAPGPIFVLRREMKYANRKIVEATAIALAYEGPSRKAAKRKAAEPLLTAYDNRLKEKEQPSAAAAEVLREIALP